MYRYKLLLFSVLPGVLLWLAWPPMDFYILAFVAFVPLFMLEEGTREQKGYFWWVYVAMLIFNITTTWWVWNASAGGAIAMMLANSLLMTLPFMLYRKAIRYFGASKALFTFICFWMAFEYLHLNWEITWPWLSLGNVFAKHNYVVQWYEYTGMLGAVCGSCCSISWYSKQ